MIVYDLNILRAFVPAKAYPELIVHADAVLPGTVAFQSFQPVAWRTSQIIQPLGSRNHFQLTARHRFNVPKPLYPLTVEHPFGFGTPEALDHALIVYRYSIYNQVAERHP
jgi:hypothetical protein